MSSPNPPLAPGPPSVSGSAPVAPEARLLRRAVGFAAAGSLVGLAFGPRIGLSVLGGAVVSVLNIVVLRRVAAGFTASGSARSALALAALTGVRYLLLGSALFAIIAVWNADAVGVALGLGAPLLAVLLELGSVGFGAFRPPQGHPSTRSASTGSANTGSANPGSE